MQFSFVAIAQLLKVTSKIHIDSINSYFKNKYYKSHEYDDIIRYSERKQENKLH